MTVTKIHAAYIQSGDQIDFTNSGEEVIVSGSLVSLGYISGVAASDIPAKATGVLTIRGIFDIAKETATEFKAGDQICLRENKLQKHIDGDQPVGVAVADAGNDSATVRIALNM